MSVSPLQTIVLVFVLSLGVALAVFTAFVPSSADRAYAFLRKPKVRLALSGCSALLSDSWNSSHMSNRGFGAALVIASVIIFYAFWKRRSPVD
jgi:hypothetical protein